MTRLRIAVACSYLGAAGDGWWMICAGHGSPQVHFFNIQNGKLYGKINWRVTEPDGEFFAK